MHRSIESRPQKQHPGVRQGIAGTATLSSGQLDHNSRQAVWGTILAWGDGSQASYKAEYRPIWPPCRAGDFGQYPCMRQEIASSTINIEFRPIWPQLKLNDYE